MKTKCIYCKQEIEVANPEKYTTKNGKDCIRGTCPVCLKTIYRFPKKKKKKSPQSFVEIQKQVKNRFK